ncbi:MAG: hypothetical protein ACYC3I_09205 [Gemmataceae bacterium]
MSYDPHAYSSDISPPSKTGEVRNRIMVPAILLIVVGVLNLLLAIGPAFYGFGVSQLTPAQLEQQLQTQNPQQLADLKKAGYTVDQVRTWLLYGFFIWAAVAFLASLLVILGAIRMMSLKNYGLALFASILAALPFVSCSGCCGVGEIAGIWALIVLLSAEVKAAFS